EPAPLVVAGRDDPDARGAQLLLLPPALRDVETAGDDPDELAHLVVDGRAAPRDHAVLAARVREPVLVPGRGPVRRGRTDGGADAPAVPLDDRRDPSRARRGQLVRAAVAVDVAPSLVEPEGQLERRVAERLRDRVAQRDALADRDDEAADRAAREPAAQDPVE